MKILPGEKYPVETLIVVPVSRLEEEYQAGKEDQQADEHWRKNARIATGFGLTMLPILGVVAEWGGGALPYIALLLHFFVHVVL